MRLTRRSVVRTGVLAACRPSSTGSERRSSAAPAAAQDASPSASGGTDCRCSASSNIRPGFKHFDYVNPNAPKAGTVRMIAFGTFDNFNEVVAGLKGSIAMGAGMLSDTLMVSSLDEVSTDYGLIAEAVSHPPDFASATFRLRAGARHHDGKPVTVDDVIFSMESVQEAQPDVRGLLSARREDRADRRARGHLHLRRARATAKCR